MEKKAKKEHTLTKINWAEDPHMPANILHIYRKRGKIVVEAEES